MAVRNSIRCCLSPAKLRTYGVTLKQVTQALAASNQNVSAGFMVVSGAEYLVTGLGRVRTPEDIGAVVVAAEDGVPIRVADLGRVQVDAAPKRGEGSVNTQPAVILGVQKQPGTNTLTLTRTLEAVLHDLQAQIARRDADHPCAAAGRFYRNRRRECLPCPA